MTKYYIHVSKDLLIYILKYGIISPMCTYPQAQCSIQSILPKVITLIDQPLIIENLDYILLEVLVPKEHLISSRKEHIFFTDSLPISRIKKVYISHDQIDYFSNLMKIGPDLSPIKDDYFQIIEDIHHQNTMSLSLENFKNEILNTYDLSIDHMMIAFFESDDWYNLIQKKKIFFDELLGGFSSLRNYIKYNENVELKNSLEYLFVRALDHLFSFAKGFDVNLNKDKASLPLDLERFFVNLLENKKNVIYKFKKYRENLNIPVLDNSVQIERSQIIALLDLYKIEYLKGLKGIGLGANLNMPPIIFQKNQNQIQNQIEGDILTMAAIFQYGEGRSKRLEAFFDDFLDKINDDLKKIYVAFQIGYFNLYSVMRKEYSQKDIVFSMKLDMTDPLDKKILEAVYLYVFHDNDIFPKQNQSSQIFEVDLIAHSDKDHMPKQEINIVSDLTQDHQSKSFLSQIKNFFLDLIKPIFDQNSTMINQNSDIHTNVLNLKSDMSSMMNKITNIENEISQLKPKPKKQLATKTSESSSEISNESTDENEVSPKNNTSRKSPKKSAKNIEENTSLFDNQDALTAQDSSQLNHSINSSKDE